MPSISFIIAINMKYTKMMSAFNLNLILNIQNLDASIS